MRNTLLFQWGSSFLLALLVVPSITNRALRKNASIWSGVSASPFATMFSDTEASMMSSLPDALKSETDDVVYIAGERSNSAQEEKMITNMDLESIESYVISSDGNGQKKEQAKRPIEPDNANVGLEQKRAQDTEARRRLSGAEKINAISRPNGEEDMLLPARPPPPPVPKARGPVPPPRPPPPPPAPRPVVMQRPPPQALPPPRIPNVAAPHIRHPPPPPRAPPAVIAVRGPVHHVAHPTNKQLAHDSHGDEHHPSTSSAPPAQTTTPVQITSTAPTPDSQHHDDHPTSQTTPPVITPAPTAAPTPAPTPAAPRRYTPVAKYVAHRAPPPPLPRHPAVVSHPHQQMGNTARKALVQQSHYHHHQNHLPKAPINHPIRVGAPRPTARLTHHHKDEDNHHHPPITQTPTTHEVDSGERKEDKEEKELKPPTPVAPVVPSLSIPVPYRRGLPKSHLHAQKTLHHIARGAPMANAPSHDRSVGASRGYHGASDNRARGGGHYTPKHSQPVHTHNAQSRYAVKAAYNALPQRQRLSRRENKDEDGEGRKESKDEKDTEGEEERRNGVAKQRRTPPGRVSFPFNPITSSSSSIRDRAAASSAAFRDHAASTIRNREIATRKILQQRMQHLAPLIRNRLENDRDEAPPAVTPRSASYQSSSYVSPYATPRDAPPPRQYQQPPFAVRVASRRSAPPLSSASFRQRREDRHERKDPTHVASDRFQHREGLPVSPFVAPGSSLRPHSGHQYASADLNPSGRLRHEANERIGSMRSSHISKKRRNGHRRKSSTKAQKRRRNRRRNNKRGKKSKLRRRKTKRKSRRGHKREKIACESEEEGSQRGKHKCQERLGEDEEEGGCCGDEETEDRERSRQRRRTRRRKRAEQEEEEEDEEEDRERDDDIMDKFREDDDAFEDAVEALELGETNLASSPVKYSKLRRETDSYESDMSPLEEEQNLLIHLMNLEHTLHLLRQLL